MCTQTVPQEDRPTALITPRSPWRVVAVEVLPHFQLNVRFIDGTHGVVDMSARVHAKDAGVFARLADPERFAEAFVEYGVVTWPGELDLAPDAMHRAIKTAGKWTLS